MALQMRAHLGRIQLILHRYNTYTAATSSGSDAFFDPNGARPLALELCLVAGLLLRTVN